MQTSRYRNFQNGQFHLLDVLKKFDGNEVSLDTKKQLESSDFLKDITFVDLEIERSSLSCPLPTSISLGMYAT